MQEIQASSGQGWARAAVAIGAVLSVSGNITHTVLTPSTVDLAIRIVQSAFLPVILFVAVEVFVRVAWRRGWLDFIGRAMLIMLPGFGAGYVSFFHLRDLSVLSGEDRIGSIAGPLAIDGLMIGGAVALLAIRAARLTAITPAPVPAVLEEPQEEKTEAAPAPLGPPIAEKVTERPARAPKSEMAAKQEKAIRLLLEGRRKDAVEAELMGDSTIGRYAKAMRILRDDALAEIDCKAQKVQPHLIEIMRQELKMERAR